MAKIVFIFFKQGYYSELSFGLTHEIPIKHIEICVI